jgi:preprotein translocase subunit SecD
MKAVVALGFLLVPFLVSADPVKPAKAVALEFRLVAKAETPGLPRLPILGDDRTLPVERKVLMDARAVAAAEAVLDRMGRPQISLTLTAEGTKTFAEITRKNVKRQLAMVSDGKVLSAPTIQTEIAGGKAVITGSFTMKKAREIAAKINEAAKADPK